MRKLALCALMTVVTVLGSDVAGNWKGNAYRPDGTQAMEVVLTLKQESDKVSGMVGANADEQVPISNAKLDGDKLKFEVVTDNGVYNVALTLSSEDLKGNATRTLDGKEGPPMRLELKRAK